MGLTKSQRRRKWLMNGLDEDMKYFYDTEDVRKKIEDK